MSIRYVPEAPPADPKDLPSYLTRELNRMSEVINNISDGNLSVIHSAPPKPRQGNIRYADGTDWEPVVGGGEGLYIYLSTGWSKL